MLLNIYLGTTAISWATVLLTSIATTNKLKRKGYTFVKENKSLSEKIMSYISTIFQASIPIYNILNTICILCMGEKVYDIMEEKLLKQGKIYIESDANNVEDEVLQERNVNLSFGRTNNITSCRSNSEMTNEEKLEYLKELRRNLSNNQEGNNEQENPKTKSLRIDHIRK